MATDKEQLTKAITAAAEAQAMTRRSHEMIRECHERLDYLIKLGDEMYFGWCNASMDEDVTAELMDNATIEWARAFKQRISTPVRCANDEYGTHHCTRELACFKEPKPI
jgi:hypothetical protein